MEALNQLEAGWLLWIQDNLRNEVCDVLMPFISEINNSGLISILTVIMLLLFKQTRRTGVVAFISLLTEFVVVNIILKPSVMRTRPFLVNEALQLLGDLPTDYSFPSGHTGSAFAVAFVCMFCLRRRYSVVAMTIASLIAFSRLYNAAHYPTDVLGALLIALATSWIAFKIVEYWTQNRKRSI